MKERGCAGLEFRDHVLAEVAEPLLMALKECDIALLIGLEGLKLGVLPAGIVALQVLHDVVFEEGLQQTQLEIVLVMELLALLSLEEVVCAVLVAVLDDVLFKLLLAEGLQAKDDSVLDVELGSLESID